MDNAGYKRVNFIGILVYCPKVKLNQEYFNRRGWGINYKFTKSFLVAEMYICYVKHVCSFIHSLCLLLVCKILSLTYFLFLFGSYKLGSEHYVPEFVADTEANGAVLIMMLHVVNLHHLQPWSILWSGVVEEIMDHIINHVRENVTKEEAVHVLLSH